MNRAKRGPRPAVRGTAALGLAILLGFMCAPRISSAQSPAKDVPAAPQASGAPSVPAAPQSASATPAGPTAAERFKNIQVLKDIPADSLIPSMNFISASLGVECAFCHVNPFDKDEKQEKATAREMITMTMAINKDNFKGHREVTCNTCHRGASKPVAIPLFMEASATAPAPEKAANPPSAMESMPSPDQIVEKYTQLIGGLDAVSKLATRTDRATVEGGRLSGTLMDSFKAPGKAVSVLHTSQGDFTEGTEGVTAWQMNMRGQVLDHSSSEQVAAKQAANFTRTLDIKKNFTQMRLASKEKVGDSDAYQIFAQAADGSGRVRLFFDAQSGLLIRLVSYEQSPMGTLPTEFDYSDYREVNGVKVPFVVRVSKLGPGNVSTEHFTEIKFNTDVDDSKFVKPAPKAAAPASN